jgi:putative ABC transport system ATP-binding protein
MSLLEVRRVSHRYGDGKAAVAALDNVSFSLDQGLLLAVLGPSGSGKTTLLSVIAGLLTPTSGEVILDGQEVHLHTARETARFRRQNIGIVFQEYHLIPYLTARENLLLVPHLRGGISGEDRGRADALLGEFDLGARARHKPAELSGGERQRVAIARAFMNEPKVMLVDEPTSHLDTERGRQVLELLRDHIHGRAMTCVMVTHDQRMTDQADQTLRLVDGIVQG